MSQAQIASIIWQRLLIQTRNCRPDQELLLVSRPARYTMIRFILVQASIDDSDALDIINVLVVFQNRQGKTRLSKWYVPYDDDEKVSYNVAFWPKSLLLAQYFDLGSPTR